ncbi:MAG: hypothetical protein ACK50L_01955 [Bacteroidota bacterium]
MKSNFEPGCPDAQNRKTIGILYRQRKVSLEENGVKLIDGNN